MVDFSQFLSRPVWRAGVKLHFIVCLAVLAIVLSAGAARAAENEPTDLQFDVFFGYDQIVPEATWIPVVCEIQNNGPSFQGAVEVSPGTTYDTGQTVKMPVELPNGTLKRIVIPVFSQSRGGNWTVRLLDEHRRVRDEKTVEPRRQMSRGAFLIGGLAHTPGGNPVLRPRPNDQTEDQPASARFLPSIFPDNPLVLEGLNALYISSEEVPKLRPAQANAILGWLNAGGHLIIGVEQASDITAEPWLQEIMPCDLGNFKSIGAHPEIEDWLRTPSTEATPVRGTQRRFHGTAPPAPDNPFSDVADDSGFELADIQVCDVSNRDGRVVLTCGGAPLIVTADRGLGQITVLTFSPEREPFRSWKNLSAFWSKVAGSATRYTAQNPAVPPNPGYYAGVGAATDGVFGAMIDSRQVHKLPAGWLLLLLLVYLVVIGPLDQYWLKRIGRPMLTWITFPCYVVFFSLLIYFIGYKLRAGESEWNELHVVDVLPNGDHAELRGTTYVSLYSPANQRYHVKGPQKFATVRGEFYGFYGGGNSERLDVTETGDSFDAELFVPVWSSQLFVSDWWESAPMPFEVKVTPRGDGWTVTVTNHLDTTLSNMRLALPGLLFATVGDCPANQSKTYTVSRSSARQLQDFVGSESAGFAQVTMSRRSALGSSERGQISDLPDASMAASFISLSGATPYGRFASSPGLDLTRTVEHGEAVLLAWSDHFTPESAMNQFTPRRSDRHTLWRCPVTVTE